MGTSIMDNNLVGTYAEQMKLLRRSLGWWKIIAYFIGLSFLLLTILGFAFQVVFFGLAIGLWRLAIVFDPAYRLLVALLGLKGMPPHLLPPPKWYVIYSMVMLVIPLLIIIFGLAIIHFAGFCPQNWICLIMQVYRRSG